MTSKHNIISESIHRLEHPNNNVYITVRCRSVSVYTRIFNMYGVPMYIYITQHQVNEIL